MSRLQAQGHTSQNLTPCVVLVLLLALTGTSWSFQDNTTCGERTVPVTGGSGRIVGGKPAQDGEWPWQAYMEVDGAFACGASLVDPSWILTAAHCLGSILTRPDLFRFSMGSNQLYDVFGPHHAERTAEKIFMHPNYTIYEGYAFDVALLKLTQPFQITDYVRTVCVPTAEMVDDFPVGTPVTVTGWGSTSEGSYISYDLLQVTLPIVDQDDCETNYGQAGSTITEDMMCAGETGGGKDSCHGDSGGPLVAKKDGRWFELGVVSFGIGCARAEYPGVYARMTAFEDWIAPIFDGNEPIGQDSDCTSRGKYLCKYGGCIPYDMKCNGEADCYTGSDEDYCDFPLTFFDPIYGKRLATASVTRQEFVPEAKDCAALCLASSSCVAFDVEATAGSDGGTCSLADAGFDVVDGAVSSLYFQLGQFKAPSSSENIEARHGYIGFPIQVADSTDTRTEFSWDIEPSNQVNAVKFHFTSVHTDEAVNISGCNNYVTLKSNTVPPHNQEFCLFDYASEDSFKATVDNSIATVTFKTEGIAMNGFVAEFLAEWQCDQTINVTEAGGTITSPNYPSTYPRFLNCQILLEAPYGRQVWLTPTDFDTLVCAAGHSITVYDVTDAGPVSLADCSMGSVPNYAETTGGIMKIVFTSDKYSYNFIKGFNLSYGLTKGNSSTLRPTEDSNCTSRGKYLCKYEDCIPYDMKCDGKADCYTGSDEDYCDFPLTFFDPIYGQRLATASVTRREFLPEAKDCAALCLASSSCVAFDMEATAAGNGGTCSLADAGFDVADGAASSLYFQLGQFKAPSSSKNIEVRHGYIGFPIQVADSTDTRTKFSWDIEPSNQVNAINFHFTNVHTDEAVNNSDCNNYVTLKSNTVPPHNQEFCLFKYASEDSFKATVDNSNATVSFTTEGIATNGFLVEFLAEWQCDQTINVTEAGGTIISPNYPSAYPRFLNCQILLEAPYGRQVRLTPTDFDIYVCLAGHSITVYDVTDAGPVSLADCSMGSVPNYAETTGGIMKIVFTSDSNSYGFIRGFNLSYGLTDWNTPTPRPKDGTPTSSKSTPTRESSIDDLTSPQSTPTRESSIDDLTSPQSTPTRESSIDDLTSRKPTPTRESSFDALKAERDTLQTALIGVSIGAGVAIFCLLGCVIKQLSKLRKVNKLAARNTTIPLEARQDPRMAGHKGMDNRAFNIQGC